MPKPWYAPIKISKQGSSTSQESMPPRTEQHLRCDRCKTLRIPCAGGMPCSNCVYFATKTLGRPVSAELCVYSVASDQGIRAQAILQDMAHTALADRFAMFRSRERRDQDRLEQEEEEAVLVKNPVAPKRAKAINRFSGKDALAASIKAVPRRPPPTMAVQTMTV